MSRHRDRCGCFHVGLLAELTPILDRDGDLASTGATGIIRRRQVRTGYD